MESLEKFARERANINARVHAIGWAGLLNAFKSSSDSPIEFIDLLPFGEDLREANKQISDRTKKIIQQALESKTLSMPVASALCVLIQ